MATDKPKFTVIIDNEVDEALEAYRRSQSKKIPSKSAVAAYFIKKGLISEGLLKPL